MLDLEIQWPEKHVLWPQRCPLLIAETSQKQNIIAEKCSMVSATREEDEVLEEPEKVSHLFHQGRCDRPSKKSQWAAETNFCMHFKEILKC